MNELIFEIKKEGRKDNYGKFIISPLAQGYGNTLGNSLRRVLLTDLPGAAITSVRITGVKHQFSTLKGMKQDIVEFVLNLKKVRFSYDSDKPINATLSVKGPGEVKAKDIKVPANIRIANPELVLALLNKGTKLDVKMKIESGVGYQLVDESSKTGIGLIPLDASFSPVVRVNHRVEETRVGRFTNYDKLILEIWTDGTMNPTDALKKASGILIAYFNQIVTPKKTKKKVEKVDDGLGTVGNLSVEEIALPTRVANALVKAGFETVEALVKAKREELVKVRNLGEKSIKIIDAALAEKNVRLEM
ncbi:DNA-directed RNA polymerase subunit alpha [Patescibacteria group bacterium]|nr:DNA-directed RNA polymerase subunit alpha [Patescibacteria group bacterium]MBU0776818.1 DNA-directed RNA polymerase subunit alpha [Patescibacteria group bacterium]MBU0845607.1 DNA-directed RNA polymerase subunit alpha [Patescibacteria group bacterium]MBU0922649.1 DNA-directed RNA polymerase subunit alpha [Patescibacteria group bacterium]MBU1066700.1 DNA-directed RNA polymerase subunit alpha [Patescibacteria group bacterium]